MSEELQLFLEDSAEQLTFMENALLSMQDEGVNDEDVGALFRSMHTIKGTAGMFGFDDVVGFAHIAENLLSEVRSQKVELTPEMIQLFLLCKDHTENLIDAAVEQTPIDELTRETNQELLDHLLSFMPGAKTHSEQSSSNGVSTTTKGKRIWHVSIEPNADFFNSGMDVLNILNFLEVMGKITKKRAYVDPIPRLEGLNPLQAYMGIELQIESESSKAEIEDVFEFVMDDVALMVFDSADKVSLVDWVESIPHKQSKIKFLIESGFFAKEDFITETVLDISSPEPELYNAQIQQVTLQSAEVMVVPEETKNTPKKESAKNFSLRVDSSKIDQLINQISEMVIANAKIAQRADMLDDNDLSEATTVMSEMLESVRSSVMNIRMVQVGDTFAKFKRIVNDTAKKLGKDIDFEIHGGETELDKMVVEKISDPIMHMLRNSIDHGVEMPHERIASGKSGRGKVTLSAYPDAGTIVIKIVDDGRGLNRDKILAKSIANGIVSPNQHLSDKEIFNLIFAAGLSTADQVSDISGRGVGMDVVKRNIEELRGTVEIDSVPSQGSTFTIRLPLTLAIIDGFLVQSGDTKYIIPLEMIQECIELSASYKKQMKGNNFINLRDSILPLLDIRQFFSETENKSDRENVVVLRYGDHRMGLQVDELYGEFQTVIKPLGEVFGNVNGISGGTVLGSGDIALIFDIPKLMEYQIRNH